MREQLAERLQALRQEYQTGQTMLAELEAKQLDLRQTLLRIAGAIQVLEELLADAEAPGPGLAAGAPDQAGAGNAEDATGGLLVPGG
jgi:hypothetical protein